MSEEYDWSDDLLFRAKTRQTLEALLFRILELEWEVWRLDSRTRDKSHDWEQRNKFVPPKPREVSFTLLYTANGPGWQDPVMVMDFIKEYRSRQWKTKKGTRIKNWHIALAEWIKSEKRKIKKYMEEA